MGRGREDFSPIPSQVNFLQIPKSNQCCTFESIVYMCCNINISCCNWFFLYRYSNVWEGVFHPLNVSGQSLINHQRLYFKYYFDLLHRKCLITNPRQVFALIKQNEVKSKLWTKLWHKKLCLWILQAIFLFYF